MNFLSPRLKGRFHPTQKVSLFDFYKKRPELVVRALEKLVTFTENTVTVADPGYLFNYHDWIKDKGKRVTGLRGYNGGLIYDVA